jgi:hypothetical protein
LPTSDDAKNVGSIRRSGGLITHCALQLVAIQTYPVASLLKALCLPQRKVDVAPLAHNLDPVQRRTFLVADKDRPPFRKFCRLVLSQLERSEQTNLPTAAPSPSE